MKKRFKVPLFAFVILILLIIGLLVAKSFFAKPEDSKVKVVDSIDNFSYTLDERDSKLMKKKYNELKDALKEKDIDYEKYAQYIAELFVIDLFTMDNKLNKYDVGSIEYVYPDAVDNFKSNVEDTIYKKLENNSDGKRNQELPIVSNINIESSEKTTYLIGSEEDGIKLDGYVIKLNWDYEKELDYDKEAVVTLVIKDNKAYVVEYKVGEEDE